MLTIATRESRLALWQAEHVRSVLMAMQPGSNVALLGMTTVGDQRLDRPLSEIGGKGLFTKELETALLDGRAHLAVHSLKDVPMQLAPAFALAAVMAREDPRDAFVSPAFAHFEALPLGATVGTSSLRRRAQLLRMRPDLKVLNLRGNLDTRLAKLDRGEYDAIVLAAAGLKRLGMGARIRHAFEPAQMLPSPGQGALGLECLAGAHEVQRHLAPLNDSATRLAVMAERAVSAGLGGNCKLPLAAFGTWQSSGQLSLSALVISLDGAEQAHAAVHAPVGNEAQAQALGAHAVALLKAQGAQAILDRCAV